MQHSDYGVLFVDDEVSFLNALKRELAEESLLCFFASSVADAWSILRKERIGVVVTDLRMPHTSGLEFLRAIREKHPQIMRIILTGVVDLESVLLAIATGETHRYLNKPVRIREELLPAIYQSLDHVLARAEHQQAVCDIIRKNAQLTRQAEIIRFFQGLMEKENQNKTRILRMVQQELKPFLLQMMMFLEDMDNPDRGRVNLSREDLRRQGRDIIKWLGDLDSSLIVVNVPPVNGEGVSDEKDAQ